MEIGSATNDAREEDSSLPALWELDSSEYECDCPGPPPPPFRIPPPPRPPFLPEVAECSEVIADYESCDVMTVINPGYREGNPSIPTLTILVTCSLLLLAGAFIVFALAWKHKKKMQNFLPCKSSPQNRCDVAHGNGVIYEDVTSVRPRVQPPSSIEMLDVKSHHNSYVISHPSVFICPPPIRPESQYSLAPRQDHHRYGSQDLYNPVYEELSNGSADRGESDAESECIQELTRSDDEFAEDELSLGEHHRLPAARAHSGASSLQGSTGNDLCRDVDSSDADDRSRFLCHRGPCLRNGAHHANGGGSSGSRNNHSLPPNRRNRQYVQKYQNRSQQSLPDQKRPRSLDRRRGGAWRQKATTSNCGSQARADSGEFHEGLLFDALYPLYPNNVGLQVHPNSGHHIPPRLPYILPVSANAQQPLNAYEAVPVLNHIQHQNYNQQQKHRRQQLHNATPPPPQYYSPGLVVRGSQENFANAFRPNSRGQTSNESARSHAAAANPSAKPVSQDSDSGYSNNTSGGRGSSSSRSKSDTSQRASTHNEFPLS